MSEVTNSKNNLRNSCGNTRKEFPAINIHVTMIAFIPILVGGFIYVMFRADTIRLFHWLFIAGLYDPIMLIRRYAEAIIPYIPEWIIYSFPNGLWVFSYAFIMTYLWSNRNSVIKYVWLFSIPFLGLGYEALQYVEVIPGAFCYQDLLFCFIGLIIGVKLAVIYQGGLK